MRSRSTLSILVLILALGLVLAGCGGAGGGDKKPAAENKAPLKIGFFAPVTGPAAADGDSVTKAAKLAVEKINKSGGINGRQVELVAYDDNLKPQEAVSIAQKLTTKDGVVAAVSGSYSHTTRAAAPIFENAKIPMIAAYALHPDITKGGDYVFRQSFVGTAQGKAGGYVAVELLKAKTVAILNVDNDFGTTLADSFTQYVESKGAKVVSRDKFTMVEKEFNPVLTKIKQLKPDLIYMPTYSGTGAQIARQAKELNLGIQILGTEGIDSTEEFLKVSGKTADGIIITTNLNRESKLKATQEFIKDYTAMAGHAPDMVAASTYDCFMVLAESMRKNGTEPDKIKDGIYKIKDFEAATGLIKGYNPLGEVTKNVQVQIVKDGVFKYYGEISDPAIITPPDK